MDDEDCLEREARFGLGLDGGFLGLGHARIMIERHAATTPSSSRTMPVKVDNGADIAPPGLQPRNLGADVEILPLDPDLFSRRSPAGRRRSRARLRSAAWRT